MKVIIPVAGAGTRLQPHTYSRPKPLLHVGGKPMIAHLLDAVVPLKPEEVIFVVGYMGERIRAYVTANYSFKSVFVQQDELLGLGYALNLALTGVESSQVLIILGDTIVECDLGKFVQTGDYVLGLREVDDPHRFGIAEIADGRVIRLEEKPENPKTNLAVIGLYYFADVRTLKSALQKHVDSGKLTRGEIQFTDALQEMISNGTHFVPYEVREWYDCGKKETMLETNRHLLERLRPSPRAEGSIIIPPVYVAPTANVVESILGPHVSIAEGATINRSIISNSIVGGGATIEDAILKDSLVGHRAIIKGGAPVLNVGDSSDVST